MTDVTHLSPQQQRIFNLLARTSNHLSGYTEPTLHADITAMLAELSDPKTTDLTHEVGAGSNSFPLIFTSGIETATGADLDYFLFGAKRPAGMTDVELRDILRNRSFADILACIKHWRRT